jgi:hypothetical protein
MTAPPSLRIFLIVGTAEVIRVSSVTLKLASKGTLKSTRINAFFPPNATLSTVLIPFFIVNVFIVGLKIRN